MLDKTLMHITNHTRIIFCRAIATYNLTLDISIIIRHLESYKVKNYDRLIIKRAAIIGFLYFDYPELPGSATITQMLKQEQLKIRYDIIEISSK